MQQLQPNTLLQGGKYKIEKTLGQGSFGITYLAEQIMLERKVAIKEFFMKELNSRGEDGSVTGMTDGSLSYNYGQKFIKEAINLSRLDHPNIVRVTDSFQENGTYYYVMDYIDGVNLNDYIKEHPLKESDAVSIIKDVADALIYMHDKKHMLHLDLKPGNVMRRSEDGHIFLIDFGLSKHFSDDGQPETSTTIGLGTPGYAPIEQGNKSKNGEFRPTIDVYSIGATFFKLLTGKTPPTASDLVSDDELASDELKDSGISENIANVVIKAMMPSVKKRIQNVSSFKEMLDTVGSVSTEEPKTPANPVNKTPDNPVVNDKIVDNKVTENNKSEETTVLEESNLLKKDILTFKVNGLSFNMIKVEGGSFQMGSNDGYDNEKPIQSVALSDYYIGEKEVTQALWTAVMGNNPSFFKGDFLPIEQVSWNDCQEFVKRLNQKTGRRFSLPTEAQWEFAARGGNKSQGYYYAGSNNIDDVAWYNDNSYNKTHTVGSKHPNELGIYDMSGNVREWCKDFFGTYGSQPKHNPSGPLTGWYHIERGGGWNVRAYCCRLTNRDYYYPAYKHYDIGFRLALEF